MRTIPQIAGFLDFLRLYKRNSLAVVGLVILSYLSITAIIAPYLTPHSPFQLVGEAFSSPSLSGFPMGSDDLGRDLYAMVMYGARVSLLVGFLAAAISAFVGTVIGCVSGYTGGIVDDVLMRTTEIFQVIPRFFLALVLVALVGPNISNIILAIGIVSWPRSARLVRSMFLSLKEQEFVEASRSLGASPLRIIFLEILPNSLSPLIVNMSLEVGSAILAEAGLSFIGLGDPSQMSWGYMLYNAQSFMRRAWWVSFFPGLYLFLTVLSFNMIGDGLNEAFNPKLRERQ